MPIRYNSIPKITLPETAAQIRQAMREGNIAEAVNLFHRTGEKESVALFEKFAEAQQQYESNIISLEEWGRVQTQTCHSILVSGCMPETEMPQKPFSEIKAKTLQMLQKHKTEQALAFCEGFGDEYLLLQAELYAAKNQCGKGLIESEYFEAIKSKINYSLEELMGQIIEPATYRGLWGRFRSLFK